MTDLEQIKRVFKQREHEKTAVAIAVMLFCLAIFLICMLDKYF